MPFAERKEREVRDLLFRHVQGMERKVEGKREGGKGEMTKISGQRSCLSIG